jgi:hypothetical protein
MGRLPQGAREGVEAYFAARISGKRAAGPRRDPGQKSVVLTDLGRCEHEELTLDGACAQ